MMVPHRKFKRHFFKDHTNVLVPNVVATSTENKSYFLYRIENPSLYFMAFILNFNQNV